MRIHIVRPKETFVTIANKYQVTLDDLRQFNPDFIQPDCLVAGMKVYVPNLKKVTEAFQESDLSQSPMNKKELKGGGKEEGSLTQTNHVMSSEQKGQVLSDKTPLISMKEDKQTLEIKKQTTVNKIETQKKTKKIQQDSQPPHVTGVQTPKRKYYEPWPPIKRTAQSCQYNCGYWDHCR